jgi:hypothetical protein
VQNALDFFQARKYKLHGKHGFSLFFFREFREIRVIRARKYTLLP